MIVIKNAKIPSHNAKVSNLDLLYDEKEGKIIEIGPSIDTKGCQRIDAKGGYLLPRFTDIYTKIQAPDNANTTSLCAHWGGYGNILVIDSENNTEEYNFLTPEKVNVVILESGHRLNAKELSDLMENCAKNGTLIIASPKASELYPNACLTKGRTAKLLKLPCEPVSVEACSIYEYISLAKETGCKLHIRGISAEESVEIIRNAKSKGIRVTCSTSPCYFSLTDEDAVFIGANSKVYPPLRSTKDKKAIIAGIVDNTIDCIDSAHIPLESKAAIKDAPYGAVGLQTVFSAICTYLFIPGHIDIFRLCELLCFAPAEILGIEKPDFVNESSKSFILASVNEEFILTKSNLLSNGQNCPYIGMSLCGAVKNVFNKA